MQQTDFGYTDAVEFLNKEWDRVWQTKASLEQRAITLITTSGVLVTLAFGFTTAITKSKNFANFTHAEKVVLVVALAFFVVSALIALIVNLPKSYAVPNFSDVLGLSDTPMERAPLQRLTRVVELGREENNRKAIKLTLAFSAQLVGILTLGVVVGIVTS